MIRDEIYVEKTDNGICRIEVTHWRKRDESEFRVLTMKKDAALELARTITALYGEKK